MATAVERIVECMRCYAERQVAAVMPRRSITRHVLELSHLPEKV